MTIVHSVVGSDYYGMIVFEGNSQNVSSIGHYVTYDFMLKKVPQGLYYQSPVN